jgi:hypothetical protein
MNRLNIIESGSIVMRLTLILVLAQLMLIGIALAEREYMEVNNINISVELNQTHDAKIWNGIENSKDGINATARVRTLDGAVLIYVTRYPAPIKAQSPTSGITEYIEVDGRRALFSVEQGPQYYASYYPNCVDYYCHNVTVAVLIMSELPFYATADLLRTINITLG